MVSPRYVGMLQRSVSVLRFYQKDYRDAAVKVASNMPSIRTIAPMSEPERRDVKVKVIIGRDLISGVTATIQENN